MWSSSRMRVVNHNWSATKQRLHLQSVAEISRHSVLSEDRIRQCGTSSGSHRKDTDQCLLVAISFCRHRSVPVPCEKGSAKTTVAEGGQNLTINYTVIDCLQLSDTKTRDDEKMMSFPKSWYTGFSFSVWILKTWQGENDEYRTCGKISAIWWNIKINPQILAYICGYELPTKLQNFMQKDLT